MGPDMPAPPFQLTLTNKISGLGITLTHVYNPPGMTHWLLWTAEILLPMDLKTLLVSKRIRIWGKCSILGVGTVVYLLSMGDDYT
jgi:hypothetical protein